MVADIKTQIQEEASKARAEVRRTGREALQEEPRVVEVGPARGVIRAGTAKREVQTWEREQLAAVSRWESEQLAGVAAKEVSAKVTYVDLTRAEEKVARDFGIEEVNRRRRLAAEKEWAAGVEEKFHVLPSGELVAKEEYESMPSEEQKRLDELGAVGYNREVEKQQAEYKKFLATTVEVDVEPDIGETLRVDKELWESLTPRQQVEFRRTGVYTVSDEAVERERVVDVETPTGRQTMPEEEWRGYTDVERLAIALGREPTREEYRAYALEEELGVTGHPWVEAVEPAAAWVGARVPVVGGFLGGVLTGTTELAGRGPGALGTYLATGAERLIPGGEDPWWRYHVTEAAALRRWEEQYPQMRGVGELISPLEVSGFPAARVAYPQISKKDISVLEWTATGVNIAALAAPIWAPPAVRGVKWTGARIGGVAQRTTARLGTWPFSELPGLRKAPIPPGTTRLTKTIGPREAGMSQVQFDRFVKARVRTPGLTEEAFKRMDALVEEALKLPARPKPLAPAPEIARVRLLPEEVVYRARQAAAKVARASEAEVEVVRQARLKKTWPSVKEQWMRQMEEVTRLREANAAAASRATAPARLPLPSEGWVVTEAGRHMPAGARPLMVPDVPALVRVSPAFAAPRYATISESRVGVVGATRAVLSTQLAPALGRTLRMGAATTPEVGVAAVAAEAMQTELATGLGVQAFQGLRGQTISKLATTPAVSVGVSPLTRLQPRAATQMETKTVTRLKEIAKTQTQIRPRTGWEPVTSVGELAPERGRGPKTVRAFPPWLPSTDGGPKKELDGLPLVASRRQGFVTRDYYTDEEDVRARSRYTPEGSGAPLGSLQVWGRPPRGVEIHEDMGQVDVFMDLDERSVRFEGDGEFTDVGRRDPSKTRGMSVVAKEPRSLRVEI